MKFTAEITINIPDEMIKEMAQTKKGYNDLAFQAISRCGNPYGLEFNQTRWYFEEKVAQVIKEERKKLKKRG